MKKGQTAPKPGISHTSTPPINMAALAPRGRRIQVKRSKVHGNGVFAVQPLAEGEKLIEYKGERISWEEAEQRHPHDPEYPNHTFFFQLDDGQVIDGRINGNAARWANHACEPNCETREENNRVFIYTLRNIDAGEEITYNYGLILDEIHTKKVKAEYACRCGSPKCRGTMLAPKSRSRSNRKKP